MHAGLLDVLRERESAPLGPVSVAITCAGATSLYENVSVSSTPSPFGETTSDEGGDAYTPVYESSSASPIGSSVFVDGRVSSVPSNAMFAGVPLPSPIAVTAPSFTIAFASS